MPNKRKISNENLNSSQMIYIESLNAYYPTESVLNSAYRKVLDFKENAEKILEKERLETLNLEDFAKAILDSRSFEVTLQHNYIKLKCYITLEKDKNSKKNLQTPPTTPSYSNGRTESFSSDYMDYYPSLSEGAGGAKKVNVEVIMKTNPFKVEENDNTTRMELIKSESGSKMLRFSYYVRSECEKYKENPQENEGLSSNNLVLFRNDFFTIYQNSNQQISISLNEIVQSIEEVVRTEALGEKLFALLKERPRHRALLTNECKINQSISALSITDQLNSLHLSSLGQFNNQEDETYYTRELINIYGQPIVPSFHKHFNYQLSNTHYGYRTLRRLLNCEILKKYVKITKEEIKSLDRVVEFVQLTEQKCLEAFQLNLSSFFDPKKFENGIVKDWLDIWYVERLKEKFAGDSATSSPTALSSPSMSFSSFNPWTNAPKLSLPNSLFLDDQECDLWFCLKDYSCTKMDEFIHKIKNYIMLNCNRSDLILIQTVYPIFEYKHVLSEARRILAMYLCKSTQNKPIDELISSQLPKVAKDHVQILLGKFLNIDENQNKVVNFTALFEILMILKRELSKEKNDEMKYSQFLFTLERANQEKLKLAIVQLKCVPCLFAKSSSSSLSGINNLNRSLKQMSQVVSTELQQIAIDLFEKIVEDKPVKYIRLKEEFKSHSSSETTSSSKLIKQQQQQINNIINKDKKPIATTSTTASKIFNPRRDLQQFISMESKAQDFTHVRPSTSTSWNSERF
ncbi:unnamed protein product [Brachionus calyciflorus]|uniref:Uncharacterized protein n=1 Tax=Brachionus calyciflorus TaxID=104777 RepID=A0A814D134_9BILA|nr:unnamed protein product [Brachionus calyciflorus]